MLQSVTPDARHKTHFVIVDAVGVCEDAKTTTKPLDRKPSVPLDKILNLVAAGAANDDVVSTLASRLSRLDQEVDPIQQAAIQKASGGQSLSELSARLLTSIDPNTSLAPVVMTVAERYQQWMAEKQAAGISFTADLRKWLDAIKDHIAGSLNIEQDDLEDVPFNAIGGLGRAYELFGDNLAAILDELNTRLAA